MASADTGTALLILVGFVLPGFVAVLLKERMFEVRGEESNFDRLLTTAYYSVLVWSVPVVVAVAAGADRSDIERFFHGRWPLWATACVAACVLIVLPAVAAFVAWRWMASSFREALLRRFDIREAHRFASSWDWSFDGRQGVLVLVTLRSGAQVAGYFGSRSHAAFGGQRQDLFLEQRWAVEQDGEVVPEPMLRSAGVWICSDDIVMVEQYTLSNVQAA